MKYEVSVIINPIGSYYFCLLLQRYRFVLYRYNTATDEYEVNLNKNNSALISLSSLLCNEKDDGITVIKGLYSSDEQFPDNFLDLIKRLKDNQFVRDFTVRYQG